MAQTLMNFVQKRFNTVNFFMRRSGYELWKTVTSVSPAGQKKGRRSTRQPIMPLAKLYRIGAGPIRVNIPGLNQPTSSIENPLVLVEPTEEYIQTAREKYLTAIKEKSAGRKRFIEKLHPLQRGFSGTKVTGQKLGPPPSPNGILSFEGFESYCLEFKRTTKMTGNLGRKHSMNALVATGNGQGLIGYAVGRSSMIGGIRAIARGLKVASHKIFHVELLENRTIYQDFYAECRNTRIFAQRQPPGSGLHCHPRLIKLCQLIGIKDLYAKVEGSTRNYIALTHAFMAGLLSQESHEALAERKRLHVVELSPHEGYYPKIVASPINSEIKTDEEVTLKERLKLDDYYGEGRYPWKRPPKKPFYINTPGHLFAEWRKHPFRNHEKVKIRLLADDVIPRFTRTERHNWGEKRHEMVMNGVLPLPRGIGLSDIIKKN